MEPPARRPGDPPPRPPSGDGGQPGGRLPGQQDPVQRTSQLRNPTVTVEPATARATPDVATELVLGITNRSDTVNEFLVELDDPTVGWIRIEPPTKNIWPGARDTFRIIVQPPRSAEVRAGWKEYGLRIRSDGIPDGQTTASIRIEVLPFEAVDTRIVPRTSSGYTKGKHRIEVRNQGSAPWTANLTATDPEDVLRFQVPKQVLAMPGETLNVPVAVRPKAWTWVGSSSKHDFSVSLAREGGTPLKVDAQFNQRPFIPSKLIPPLIAVAVASVAIALFAAGVIPPKPPVTSPPPSEVPSVPPSVPPSEQPTESPSAEVTESPSVEVSVPPESPPPGVAQWAADAKAALFARTPSFDVGDFVGQTLTSSNTQFQVQRYQFALLYKAVSSDAFVVVRDPILEKLISVTPDVANPTIGYPLDNRRNDQGQFAQQFTEGGITCGNVGCFVLASELFDTWFAARTTMGYPIEEPGAGSDPTERLFVHTDNGWVVFEFGTGSTATCDQDKNFLGGTDPNLCLGLP